VRAKSTTVPIAVDAVGGDPQPARPVVVPARPAASAADTGSNSKAPQHYCVGELLFLISHLPDNLARLRIFDADTELVQGLSNLVATLEILGPPDCLAAVEQLND